MTVINDGVSICCCFLQPTATYLFGRTFQDHQEPSDSAPSGRYAMQEHDRRMREIEELQRQLSNAAAATCP